MTKSIRREPRVIPGFEAKTADADFYKSVEEGTAKKFGKDSRAYKIIMNGINPQNATGSNFLFNTEAGLYLPEGKRVARVDEKLKI